MFNIRLLKIRIGLFAQAHMLLATHVQHPTAKNTDWIIDENCSHKHTCIWLRMFNIRLLNADWIIDLDLTQEQFDVF